MVVGILKEISTELDDESDHVIKHLRLFVHVDGEIRLTSRQVHLLSLLEVALSLELLSLLHLDGTVLALGQVVNDKRVSLLPLVRAHIHLESFNVFTSLHKELLGLIVLADFSIVASDLHLVRADLVSGLVFDKIDSAVPVASL